jgi:hypothetical protein
VNCIPMCRLCLWFHSFEMSSNTRTFLRASIEYVYSTSTHTDNCLFSVDPKIYTDRQQLECTRPSLDYSFVKNFHAMSMPRVNVTSVLLNQDKPNDFTLETSAPALSCHASLMLYKPPRGNPVPRRGRPPSTPGDLAIFSPVARGSRHST